MIITPMLILGALAYFMGGLTRFLTVLAICLTVVFLLRHVGMVELILAGVVVFLLASKGVFAGWGATLKNWWNDAAPPPPPENGV